MKIKIYVILFFIFLTIHLYPQDTLRTGDAAIGFTLPDTAGNLISLSDFSGDIILLNFFASWCGPCQIEAPQLEDSIWQVYQDYDVTVIGLDFMEQLFFVSNFIKQYNLTYPVVLDTSGHVFSDYQLTIFPSNVLINRDGYIAYIEEGFDIPLFVHLIDSLLNVSDIDEKDKNLILNPGSIKLLSAFPNPFNAQTEISFTLSAKSDVIFTIFDLNGRIVSRENRRFSAGRNSIIYNAENNASGIYFYSLATSSHHVHGKLILQK